MNPVVEATRGAMAAGCLIVGLSGQILLGFATDAYLKALGAVFITGALASLYWLTFTTKGSGRERTQ